MNKYSSQINEEILFVISTGKEEGIEMEKKEGKTTLFYSFVFQIFI